MAETISTVPKDEYNTIGFNFEKANEDVMKFFNEHDVKQLDKNCFYLFSREYKHIHYLCQNEVERMSFE
jgi:hypothetical protein